MRGFSAGKNKQKSDNKALHIGRVIQRLFISKSSKRMTELYEEFINGDGMKRLMDFQQKAFYREKELERQRMIREKYDYYKYREKNNLPIKEEPTIGTVQLMEEYAKHIIEINFCDGSPTEFKELSIEQLKTIHNNINKCVDWVNS